MRHGTETPALEEREIKMLRKWFESGAADARIMGAMAVQICMREMGIWIWIGIRDDGHGRKLTQRAVGYGF